MSDSELKAPHALHASRFCPVRTICAATRFAHMPRCFCMDARTVVTSGALFVDHADCAAVAARENSPDVYVPSQRRAFASLSEALRHVRSGDVICLQPGAYVQREPIVLAVDGVKIVAKVYAGALAGSRSRVSVLSHTRGQDCLVVQARGCEIRGIHFVHSSCLPRSGTANAEGEPRRPDSISGPPPDSVGCINIERGDVRIINCSISNCSGFGIKVTGSSSPYIESCSLAHCREVAVLLMGTSRATLKNCHLSHNMCAGIVLLDAAAGELTGNTIAHNEKVGIVCAGSSSAILTGNAVIGGNGGGVWIRERSDVFLYENLIALSLKACLQVSDDSSPRVEKNRIINGCNGGIVVHGCASGKFSDNLISGHNKAGLGLTDQARPHFVRNRVLNNRAGGAIFTGHSHTEWHDNVVDDNLLFGMHVRGNALLVAEGGSISNNSGPGVQLQEDGHAQVRDTKLNSNLRVGAIAVGHATLALSHCAVEGHEQPSQRGVSENVVDADPHRSLSAVTATGVVVHALGMDGGCVRPLRHQRIGVQVAGDAHLTLYSSRIEGHASGNVVVQGRSTCTMTNTVIARGTWAGIVLQGSSQTSLSKVRVLDLRSAGVLCMDKAVLTADQSEFLDGKGLGLLFAGSSRALLMRNAIVGNGSTGLSLKEAACVDLRSNRISGNGLHGVALEGPCSVTALENAVFENQGSGIFSLATPVVPCTGTGIGGVPDLFALANVVVSSSAAGSVSASLDGPIKGLLSGNLLDSWHEDHSFYTDLDHSGNGYVAAEANQRHGSEQSGWGEQEGGEGGEVDTSRSAFAATNAILAAQAGSGDTLGLASNAVLSAGARQGLLVEGAAAGTNMTVDRTKLAALLCDELLPLDCYGPTRSGADVLIKMPDGGIVLGASIVKPS